MQRYIFQEEVNIWNRELSSLVYTLHDYLKTFDKESKCLQLPLPKPNIGLGSTKSKANRFAHYCKDIINCIKLDNSAHPSNLKTTFLASLPGKKFDVHGNQFIFREIFNFNHREFHHNYKKQYYVANECEKSRNNYDVFLFHPWLSVWQ